MNDKVYQPFLGAKGGVITELDKEYGVFVIRTPNTYDVYYGLLKENGQKWAEKIPSEDKSVAVFTIPIDQVITQDQIKVFNSKLANTRNLIAEYEKEKQSFHDELAIDQMHNGKPVAFIYKQPSTQFSTGEILKTGKYFIAQYAGEGEKNNYVRMIQTSKILEPVEFKDRENVIQEKCPVGSKKYIRWSENGKVHINDYTPKQAKTEDQAVEQKQEAQAKAEPKTQEETKETKQEKETLKIPKQPKAKKEKSAVASM